MRNRVRALRAVGCEERGMIYLLLFYWVVAGIVAFNMPSRNPLPDWANLLLSFSLGGFMLPAALLIRLMRLG